MGRKKPWDSQRTRVQTLLREMRRSAGLTQVELAHKIGSDQTFVSRYERGERRLDLVEIAEICEACGTTLSALVAAFEQAPNRRNALCGSR